MNTESEEQYRQSFREIYAETGQKTLNALLIISGGSVTVFLSFLGNLVSKPEIVASLDSAKLIGFGSALADFVASVALCVAAYGTTYLSHGAFHFRYDRLGYIFGGITILLWGISLFEFISGSFTVFHLLNSPDFLNSLTKAAK